MADLVLFKKDTLIDWKYPNGSEGENIQISKIDQGILNRKLRKAYRGGYEIMVTLRCRNQHWRIEIHFTCPEVGTNPSDDNESCSHGGKGHLKTSTSKLNLRNVAADLKPASSLSRWITAQTFPRHGSWSRKECIRLIAKGMFWNVENCGKHTAQMHDQSVVAWKYLNLGFEMTWKKRFHITV